MSVTLCFSSLTERQMRAVLLAHHHEHRISEQPVSSATRYAEAYDSMGATGCIVRVEGPHAYTVVTMPLRPASAAIVAAAADDPDSVLLPHRERQAPPGLQSFP